MSEQKLRRFTRIEIVHHWLQAVPYVVLFGTGGLLLAERALGLNLPAVAASGLIHRIAGYALIGVWLQIGIIALYSGDVRELAGTLREALSWKRRDITWLVKVPFQVLWPTLRLPPVHRFNAGQKLHILLIAVVVPLFSVSGLAMIFIPGALGPWILHTALFVPALVFLGVHIFCAVVNPETQRSLQSIVTGYMKRELAQDHHPLWVGDRADGTGEHPAYISWRAVAVTAILLGTSAAYGAWRYGPQHLYSRALTVIEERGATAILPGGLCALHADDPDASRCMSCHRYFESPPSSACIDCHETIQDMMARRLGYHGTFEGECRSCHAEHGGAEAELRPLDEASFNHDLARYPLEGSHRELACATCHAIDTGTPDGKRIRYIGLPFDDCTSCHSNPHENDRIPECGRCHTQEGWKSPSLLFDHDRDSRFPLDGKHMETPCADCHNWTPSGERPAVVRLTGLGVRCVDCHRDPHQPTLGEDCQRCHTASGWQGRDLYFDHNRDSSFALRGAHVSVDCTKCHTIPDAGTLASAAMKIEDTRCVACHLDPHRGQFKTECETCHSEDSWTGRWVAAPHGSGTTFPLRGAHISTECVECHQPSEGGGLATARFTGLPIECEGCHTDPHRGQMSSPCEACHSEGAWKGRFLTFSHDVHSKYKIDAIHSAVSCSACHGSGNGVTYKPLPGNCEGCHVDIVKQIEGETALHSGAPDPHMGRVTCTGCHPAGIHDPTPIEYAIACGKCHNPHYENLYIEWAKALHDREVRALQLLKTLRETDLNRSILFDEKMRTAKSTAFHNIQLARTIWDDAVLAELEGP